MKLLKAVWAIFRLGLFVLWALLQVPTLLLVVPFWKRFGVMQMRVFMAGFAKLFGLRFRVTGKLDKHRPLLLVANHISVFEVVAFPTIFGNGFFVKAEAAKWPILGWFIKNFGNVFVDRRPSKANEAIALIKNQMKAAKNPFAIFPEGTTNNGDYVLPFKSAAFSFLDDAPEVKIQPVVIFYRDKRGRKIPPQILADEYGYFVNAKQTQPPYTKHESSLWELVWRTLLRGGFLVEVHVMPLFNPDGLDRKGIASALHEIVSGKFEELK